MKPSLSFSREISKIANGDGSRDAKFAFKEKLVGVSKMLSCKEAPCLFNECLKIHGRIPVAICVAVTINEKNYDMPFEMLEWAREILNLWTNRSYTTEFTYFAFINDGLHCLKITEYARLFIKSTCS